MRRNTSRLIALCAPALLVAACQTAELDAVEKANTSGSDFHKKLAGDYKDFAIFEAKKMYDYPDANYFAGKALDANAGEAVKAEDPKDWGITEKAALGDLEQARGRLMTALANDAGAKAPAAAARAQVSYDCWVEQQQEGWQRDDIAACRTGFMRAMQVVDASFERKPTEPAAPVVKAPEPVPAAPSSYLVFFDWDSAKVHEDARSIIRAAVTESREIPGPTVYTLSGHADRSGPADYNERLSRRRAEAVAGVLMEMGVPREVIFVQARGESDPLVATGNEVRQPQNRRVNITIDEARAGA